jgi:hypothetical protein
MRLDVMKCRVVVATLTVLSALSAAVPASAQQTLADGFTQFASRSRIVILRPEGGTMNRIPFTCNRVPAAAQDNFYVLNSDVVLVR